MHMHHTPADSLIKTLTFAVLHFSVAFGVSYLITGSAPLATAIALIEPACNTVAYFFHERAWARWGQRRGNRAAAAPVHSAAVQS
ncbi:DUF2061 domain-containing protein [Piscinibacterium candidicorallinum]|jgi:uncharacterized membrane protein|uniref:DUF2061 domain-containing protein n=2 Tax=Piscinibacterium candidicorallinum TaxID=1793872 RepID=A0ABV7H2V6_9BURK